MTNAHKPYRPSAEYRYFLYDPNDGHTFYRSPEERDAAAESLIKEHLSDGEWSEDVVDVYAGEATHQVSEIERIDKVGELDEDGYDENGEYWVNDDVDCKCNYGLLPLVPSPPAEGEVGELVELVAIAADSCADEGFPNEARVCRRVAALLEQQAAELERLRVVMEALQRLRRWGNLSRLGNGGYSADVTLPVVDWIDAGMNGPLPPLPGYIVPALPLPSGEVE